MSVINTGKVGGGGKRSEQRRADALSCKSPSGRGVQGFTLSPTTSNNNLELSNIRLNVPIGAIFAASAWQVNGSASHKTVHDPQFTSFNS